MPRRLRRPLPGAARGRGLRRVPRRPGRSGFLVEAARRIIDEGGIADDDVAGLNEALRACVTGLIGTEISPFPYYLTEINLLLQVSRLLGRLSLAHVSTPPFTLGVLHADSLVARADPAASLDVGADLRADHAELTDRRFDLVPLDGAKREFFRGLREDGGFDLVIGNPPYVAEANNRPLFERLRAIAAWKGDYRGKTDYLYYFLLMALEKVRPGGRLCVITPAGWMNAGNADLLRRRLAAELRLDELYLFGGYRLFVPDWEGRTGRRSVPTPTVESAILVATRTPARANHSLRVVELEDEAAAARALSGDPEARVPDRDQLLETMARRGRGRPGRRDGIEVLNVLQSRLVADRPWPVKHATDDVAIVRYRSDGRRELILAPPRWRDTEFLLAELIARYGAACERQAAHPIVLLGAFCLDFLAIHPVSDGNGRLARLLTTHELLRVGYGIARYSSLEGAILETRDAYYAALEASQRGWTDATHDPWPWIEYLAEIVGRAYDALEVRIAGIGSTRRTSKQDLVRGHVARLPAGTTFRFRNLRAAFPQVSDQTMRLALDRVRDDGLAVVSGRGAGARWTRSGREAAITP